MERSQNPAISIVCLYFWNIHLEIFQDTEYAFRIFLTG